MSDAAREQPVRPPSRNSVGRIDPAVATAFACIMLLLAVGSFYSTSFLSPEYLLQQLKVASFLGVIATGMMIVILLGQIDLSVPWSVAVGGMMACAAAAFGPVGEVLAIPFGILCGMAIGLVNGIGVAYLRIPSMIITLATNAVAQGLMVVYTGGFSPQDSATAAMRYLATGFLLPGVPNAVMIWAVVGAAAVFAADPHDLRPRGLRHRQPRARRLSVGRRHAARRHDRLRDFRRAAALSAACCSRAMHRRRRSRWATPICCRRSPPWCSAAPRSSAARGSYLGTVAGVILITLLQSILSVMQMPEAGRQIIYGVVIVAMLLLYGRTPVIR